MLNKEQRKTKRLKRKLERERQRKANKIWYQMHRRNKQDLQQSPQKVNIRNISALTMLGLTREYEEILKEHPNATMSSITTNLMGLYTCIVTWVE